MSEVDTAIQFGFHTVCGRNLTVSNDRLRAERKSGSYYYTAAYGAKPLRGSSEFEVEVTDYNDRWSGSLRLGVFRCFAGTDLKSVTTPANTSRTPGYCVWWGGTVWNNLDGEEMKPYDRVHLNSLRTGDRVGLRLSFAGDLDFTVNGERQGVAARGVYRTGYDVYAVVEHFGRHRATRIVRSSLDIEATTPEDRVTPEKQGSDASKKEAGDTSEEETNDRKPEQAKQDITTEDFREFLDTCEKVMRDKDSVDFTAMHGILYGLPRSGKSSLLQRLIGKKPPANSPSTLAAEESVQVSIQEIRQRALEATVAIEGSDAADSTSKAIWRLVEGLEEEAVLFLNGLPQVSTSTSSPEAKPSTSTGTPTPVATAPQEPVPEATQQPDQDTPQQPDQDVSPQAKPPPPPSKDSPSPDALKYFKECLRKRNWKELKRMIGSQWYLYLTDTGGQPEFQELIAFLVSGPSIFFIVFRFDKDLDTLYEVEFIDSQGRSIKPYLSRHTAFETVLQSFSSVASLGKVSYAQEDGTIVRTKPRVLLVGTHKDMVSEEQVVKVDKRFQAAIRELDADTQGMVQWASASQMVFAVDNTQSPQAEDVQKIRNTFHRLGTDPLTRPEYQIKIPCPWLILGIMARKPDHPDPVLHFKDCVQLGQGCGIPEEKELTRALGYLDRRIGTLRHVQGKDKDHGRINFVLRNSQFLFTLVSNLILQTFTFENLPAKHHACDEFTKKGIFDSSVFAAVAETSSKVLTPAMLLTLLKQLRIVAPIQEDGNQQRYIMPCALAHVDPVKHSPQSEKPSPVKPLLFRFSCGYVPRGMFGALIAQLLQQKQATGGLQWELVEDQIFRDQVTIKLKRKTTVVLRMLPSYFSITLQSPLSLASDQGKLSRMCCEVRGELLHSITQIAQILQYGDTFIPTPCFFCPEVEVETVDSHVAIIRTDEDGEYLECSRNKTKEWEPQEVKSYSVWFHQEIPEEGVRQTTLHRETVPQLERERDGSSAAEEERRRRRREDHTMEDTEEAEGKREDTEGN